MNLSVIRQYWLYFLQKAQNRTPSCPMLVSSLPLSVHSDPIGQACRVCVTDIANRDLGFYLLSGETSYHQISWSLQAASLDALMILSLCNLTGISGALLPRYLPNFMAIGNV